MSGKSRYRPYHRFDVCGTADGKEDEIHGTRGRGRARSISKDRDQEDGYRITKSKKNWNRDYERDRSLENTERGRGGYMRRGQEHNRRRTRGRGRSISRDRDQEEGYRSTESKKNWNRENERDISFENDKRGRGGYIRRGNRNSSAPRDFNQSRNSHTVSASSRKSSNQRIHPLGVKELERLAEKEPYIIPLELLRNNSGYDKLLEQEDLPDIKLCLVLKMISKSTSSRVNSDGILDLIQYSFNNSIFCQRISRFISDIKYDQHKAVEYYKLIGSIFEFFLRIAPISAVSTISHLVDQCAGSILFLKTTTPIDELEQLFTNLSLQVKESRNRQKKCNFTEKAKYLHEGDPPDNFRDHEVIPTCYELKERERPFIRSLIVEGCYKDSEHYLDVQFRLLKEDFMRPLREGMYCYSTGNNSRNSDVRVYDNVTVESSCIEKTTLVHYLKLNLRKGFKIEHSKRFMFGNILCITSTEFETMIIGTVMNRDKLWDKIIGIVLETEPFTLDYKQKYIIIESKAYFGAYKHTLTALQELEKAPLETYVVKVRENDTPPDYLDWNTTYYLLTNTVEKERGRYRKYLEDVEVVDDTSEVRALGSIESWLEVSRLGFDDSQYRAFYGALTHQMAIIQGPPGTGKTYIGLKITQLLLLNKDKWSEGGTHPILVVCLTNHALDQFLEGILKFTKNVVRVGSQSKSETLAEYQINKCRRKYARAACDYAISNRYTELNNKAKTIKYNIDRFSAMSVAIKEPGILNQNTFSEGVIPPTMAFELRNTTMRDFLVENFRNDNQYDDQEGSHYFQNYHPVEPKFETEKEMNADLLIDNEIIREEEYDRIIDDAYVEEDPASHFSIFKDLDNQSVQFEITSSEIYNNIARLDADIQSEPYSKNTRNLYQQYTNLQLVWRTVEAGHRIQGTEGECQILERNDTVTSLNLIQRWKLYEYWIEKQITVYQKRKSNLEKYHCKVLKELLSLKDLEYLSLMKKVDIVAMTTTGAAQYCKILHDLAPPIVIVEEAAEILEAHIITSLTPKCKHLISIGDHQQLRPKPNVYELGKKYNLDVSLFERMIRNGIKHEVLEYQHRMKPEFSELLVPTLYENLKDHPSVFNFPKIKGLEKDLFFLDHTVMENRLNEDESFENLYEAEFMLGLCRHLLYQGYSTDDITIITPYLGQHRCFKRLQKTQFLQCEDVRVAILDNYQGEESNIILLSLVRSNPEGNVGFVKIDNRICVALSRAKHGMYIIGNMSQMAKAGDLWSEINEKLVKKGNIGPDIQLMCENHPDQRRGVRSNEELLLKSPEGGCKLRCTKIIPRCNHTCPRLCHVLDKDHSKANCTLPCDKIICTLGHQCPKLCSDECPPCKVQVLKQLPCSHEHLVECYIDPKDFKCPTKVLRELPHCKHTFKLHCHIDFSKYVCTFHCNARLDCGHPCQKFCHVLEDPEHDNYDCREQCEKDLQNCELGLKCKKLCFEDCGTCTVKIKRDLKCGHTLNSVMCGVLVSDIYCPFRCKEMLPCGHKCPKKCGDECGGCLEKVEKVILQCQHTCKVPCSVDPSLRCCTNKCVQELPCGHPCENKCNERCTTDCKVLVASKVKCPRGHLVQLPCHLQSKVGQKLTANCVDEYCVEMCGKKLECGHACEGKCGECYNGRLHVTCKKICNKSLVCGHLCKEPCGENCPPCQQKCPLWCSHNACAKTCGVPCINCKSKCKRGCPHSDCSQECGSKCNRDPCNEPCPLPLPKCGHACLGFCGEPCPPICRICDKDQYEEVAYGSPNARLVLLEDCNHVVEASLLDYCMSMNTVNEDGLKEIGMEKCPECDVPIYNTKRYQAIILDNLKLVKKVKSKHYSIQPKMKKMDFRNDLKDLQYVWKEEIKKIRDNLGFDINLLNKRKQRPISNLQFVLYDFQLRFLKQAEHVKRTLQGKTKNLFANERPLRHLFDDILTLDEPSNRTAASSNEQDSLKKLVAMAMKPTVEISQQTMDELSCELRRIEMCHYVEEIRARGSPSSQPILTQIETLMDRSIKFDADSETEVVKRLCQVSEYRGMMGKRLAIQQKTGLGQGNWMACPNGHVLRLLVASAAALHKCPECKTSNTSVSETSAVPSVSTIISTSVPSVSTVTSTSTAPASTISSASLFPVTSVRSTSHPVTYTPSVPSHSITSAPPLSVPRSNFGRIPAHEAVPIPAPRTTLGVTSVRTTSHPVASTSSVSSRRTTSPPFHSVLGEGWIEDSSSDDDFIYY